MSLVMQPHNLKANIHHDIDVEKGLEFDMTYQKSNKLYDWN
jgi:hypothetical protein